jgi:hypothetical protein
MQLNRVTETLDCVVENNGRKNVLASESNEGNPPRRTMIGCTRVWNGPVNQRHRSVEQWEIIVR